MRIPISSVEILLTISLSMFSALELIKSKTTVYILASISCGLSPNPLASAISFFALSKFAYDLAIKIILNPNLAKYLA